MGFRTAYAVAILLICLAADDNRALAQYYPKPPRPYAAVVRPPPPVVATQPGLSERRDGLGPAMLIGTNPNLTAAVPDDSSTDALLPDESSEAGEAKEVPPQFHRALIDYRTREQIGTIVVDTQNTYLYLVLGQGKAMRYGIGVGREGFTWSGTEKVTKMAVWPDWNPPTEMIERQPYLPRFMAGGEGNPLGARALYLGKTIYRIHGTNQPSTIGTFVSSGCIRLTNEDVMDLYTRVKIGTRVVVLPGRPPVIAAVSPADPVLPEQPMRFSSSTAPPFFGKPVGLMNQDSARLKGN